MSWNPAADLTYPAKIEVLRDYARRFDLRTLVETGLYNGRGSGMELRDVVDTWIVLDVEAKQVDAAVLEHGASCGYHGNSGETLAPVLAGLEEPALFWLDAHAVTEDRAANSSPLAAELRAILSWLHADNSVVLIDDVRMMGLPGWPTKDEVVELVRDTWAVVSLDDILRCTPRGGDAL